MKLLRSLVLSSLVLYSNVYADCRYANCSDTLSGDLVLLEKVQAEIPKIGTVIEEAHVFVESIPQSCSVEEADTSFCLFDMKNMKFIRHLIPIFSKKKGDTVVYTTENFEDILAKLREIQITSEELQLFKTNPKLCVEKLHPVLELAAGYAGVRLDEAMIEQFCSQTSLLLATVSGLSEMKTYLESGWNMPTQVAVIVGLVGFSSYLTGYKEAMSMALAGILGYMMLNQNT